ncbi:histidine phosphatase family protein [Agrobacterium tumefaciens]|uniref:histidine phosphatase family protein n=1 Tax=Agrobacterium tumefaciens TaxID=358 RepID=UPI00104E5182|nr:histidine phosphatase family protein [Agrobacterium tumefaciens]
MIYLVRHGQTEFNAAGRWQGQRDSALTALGLAQASQVGEILRSNGLDQSTRADPVIDESIVK